MSLLIAIKSCHRDKIAGFHQAIRETWGRRLQPEMTLRFFTGVLNLSPNGMKSDEVAVACDDSYNALPFKTIEILKWFLSTDKEFVFLCDNDTYVMPDLLGALPYRQYDYSGKSSLWPPNSKIGQTFNYNDGRGNTIDPCHPWASGGYGYFLSRKAAAEVIKVKPMTWAEDLFVGQVLGPLAAKGEITCYDFPEYHNRVTWHFLKYIKPFTVDEIYNANNLGEPQGRKWGIKGAKHNDHN